MKFSYSEMKKRHYKKSDCSNCENYVCISKTFFCMFGHEETCNLDFLYDPISKEESDAIQQNPKTEYNGQR